ncbi:MAG: hypothetical protein A2W05_11305 [Candidatus Schekmanbacteria bacterium RBG_16_38_10]|uniref:protein-tyrosine-phosphatase n=1 Tax=Candidatus Schekmanbacteria bacterium RBG_16_38_10 TaxID=1817879 RepID=A0A1F7S2F0_9BACT|nr:MAG: hypothetical protein A2W05_11305 [Candidatus Schekmanbacteria bacterium RBG_16_38_10]
MIDIHCHIIPEIDDGPDTIEEALAMANIAENDGIETIVATPHFLEGLYQPTSYSILNRIKIFKDLLDINKINLKIISGTDLHISHKIVERIKSNEFLTINGTRYVLIEFPSQFLHEKVRELLKKMINNSFIPIISHPERNYLFQRSPNLLYDYIKDGALAQVTAMSITGDFGYEVKKIAKKMIVNRLVQIIASDAHSKEARPPILSKAFNVVSKILSPDEANDMVQTIPESVINGHKVYISPPEKVKNLFSLFAR